MYRALLFVAALMVLSCVEQPGLECGLGLCSEDSVCVVSVRRLSHRSRSGECTVSTARCLRPERIEACIDSQDGQPCSVATDPQIGGPLCSSGFCPLPTEPLRFLPQVSVDLDVVGFGPAMRGDFNGDCRSDIAWHRPGGTNNLTIAYGVADGTFRVGRFTSNVVGFGSDGGTLLVSDLDRDGRSEFVGRSASDPSRVEVLPTDDSGVPSSSRVSSERWPQLMAPTCRMRVADLDGMNGDDLVLACDGESLRISRVLNDGAGTLGPVETSTVEALGDLSGHTLFVGDANGDGREDLIYSSLSDELNILRAILSPSDDGPLTAVDTARSRGGWRLYSALATDVTGDRATDFIFTDYTTPGRGDLPIHRSDGQSNGEFRQANLQVAPSDALVEMQAADARAATLADVNGDGSKDLVYIAQSNLFGELVIYVAVSTTRRVGVFEFLPGLAIPIVSGFTLTDVVVGDFNGDANEDLFLFDRSQGQLIVGLGQ